MDSKADVDVEMEEEELDFEIDPEKRLDPLLFASLKAPLTSATFLRP